MTGILHKNHYVASTTKKSSDNRSKWKDSTEIYHTSPEKYVHNGNEKIHKNLYNHKLEERCRNLSTHTRNLPSKQRTTPTQHHIKMLSNRSLHLTSPCLLYSNSNDSHQFYAMKSKRRNFIRSVCEVHCHGTSGVMVANVRSVFLNSFFQWSGCFTYIGQATQAHKHLSYNVSVTSNNTFDVKRCTSEWVFKCRCFICKVALGTVATCIAPTKNGLQTMAWSQWWRVGSH